MNDVKLLEDRRFYVYVYLDPINDFFNYDNYKFYGKPFYIGKGCGERCYDHLKNALNCLKDKNKVKKIKNKYKLYKIIKLIKSVGGFDIKKISENLTNDEANQLEKTLIETIGRYDLNTGPLLNLTNGGDGGVGRIYTEEQKKQKSNFFKQYIKENPNRISPRLNCKNSKETKQKISNTVKALHDDPDSVYNSKEYKEKLKKRLRDRVNDPNYIPPMKGKKFSENTIKKFSKCRKEMWCNPNSKIHNRKNMGNKYRYEIYKDGQLVTDQIFNFSKYCEENGLIYRKIYSKFSKCDNVQYQDFTIKRIWNCNSERKKRKNPKKSKRMKRRFAENPELRENARVRRIKMNNDPNDIAKRRAGIIKKLKKKAV